MLHGFEGKSCLLSVGMLTRRMWFWKSPVSMFCRGAFRRAVEKTEEFRKRYRKRSGIEGANSLLKRVTGLGRLRVRGRPSVFNSILLKVVGWNILRAAFPVIGSRTTV